MATITPAMVKELRDKTDAGMMDCKKALTETNGDMDAAVEYLRKSGITKAEKRSDRQTKEGRVYIAAAGLRWSVVESLPVSEEIKYAGPNRDALIETYKQSLENLMTKELGEPAIRRS